MTMITPETIRAIRDSWALAAPNADAVVSSFYERLFEIDPSLRPMFANTDMTAQRAKLVQALSTVVDSLENLPSITPALRELGSRHAGYGVTAVHYDTVASALLCTFEQRLGEAFTPEVRAAWTVAYALVAGVMQDGAKEDAARAA